MTARRGHLRPSRRGSGVLRSSQFRSKSGVGRTVGRTVWARSWQRLSRAVDEAEGPSGGPLHSNHVRRYSARVTLVGGRPTTPRCPRLPLPTNARVRQPADRRRGRVRRARSLLGLLPRRAAALGGARDRRRHRHRPVGARLVHVDESIPVIALIGLAFLLFLAGLEIEFDKLRGRLLRLTAAGLRALVRDRAAGRPRCSRRPGSIETPLLVAIILCATSLGVLVPVLKDAGEISSTFGQLIVAAGTIADFGAIILLSIFFSGEGGIGSTLLLLGACSRSAVVVLVVVRGAEHSMRSAQDLIRLQDTTAQIRVRGAIVLFVGFAAIADALGLEAILGAFIAGAILSLLDRDQVMTHPDFRRKLEAVGFGFFIPVFFVTSGVQFDLDALTRRAPRTWSWCRSSSRRWSRCAACPRCCTADCSTRATPRSPALMQATSLPFIVAATAIGMDLGLIDAAGGRRPDRRRPALGPALPARPGSRCSSAASGRAARPEREAERRADDGDVTPAPQEDICMSHSHATTADPVTAPRGRCPACKGKNVLVTGGSSGIGQAIAVRFAEYGANVAINYLTHARGGRRHRGAGRTPASHKVQQEGVRTCSSGATSPTRTTSCAMVGEAVERARRPRRPGQQRRHPDLAPERRALERGLRQGARRQPARARSCAPARRSATSSTRRRPASIVNVSSVHQLIPKPNYLGYSASKGGMQNLTRTLALEYAGRGIRVNGSRPGRDGHADQPRLDRRSGEAQQVEEHIPMQRAGDCRRDGGRDLLPRLRRRGLHHRPDHLRRRRPDAVPELRDALVVGVTVAARARPAGGRRRSGPTTSSGCSTTSRGEAPRGAALVREGRLYDLGHVLDEDDPGVPGPLLPPDAGDDGAPRRTPRCRVGANEVNWITEQVSATMQLGTHLDALSHLQIGDRGYNGWTVSELAGTAGVQAPRRRDRAADRHARLAGRRLRDARPRAT